MNKKPYSDPRWRDVPVSHDAACNNCMHYFGFAKCEAFPERIPRALITVEVSHDKPYPGDNGIMFTPKGGT